MKEWSNLYKDNESEENFINRNKNVEKFKLLNDFIVENEHDYNSIVYKEDNYLPKTLQSIKIGIHI